MTKNDRRLWKQQKTALGHAIRTGDVQQVLQLLENGAVPGRNQFELASRRALDGSGPLRARLLIAEVVFSKICHDVDLVERASRYIECTLITLGAANNPVRDKLMTMVGIVAGEKARTHYGSYNPRNFHTAFRPG